MISVFLKPPLNQLILQSGVTISLLTQPFGQGLMRTCMLLDQQTGTCHQTHSSKLTHCSADLTSHADC